MLEINSNILIWGLLACARGPLVVDIGAIIGILTIGRRYTFIFLVLIKASFW